MGSGVRNKGVLVEDKGWTDVVHLVYMSKWCRSLRSVQCAIPTIWAIVFGSSRIGTAKGWRERLQ